MAERKSGSRVTISGLERFFSEDMAGSKDLTDAKLEELHSFPGHPFRIVDDEAMKELSSSIRKNGVLNPLMVRKRDGGGYEIISGHRRKRAAELAELEKIPVRVLDISDEEAVLYMVDSNIQREDVLPSEKARAYRMKYEAMKHPGTRKGGKTIINIAGSEGINAKTIQRYLALSNLNEGLLGMVDNKALGFTQGVELSYLTEEEQRLVEEELKHYKYKVTKENAKKMHKLSKEGLLDKETLHELLAGQQERKSGFRSSRIRNYFPETYTDREIEEALLLILEEWKSKKDQLNENE